MADNQVYLQSVFERFNKDPNDPSFSPTEKIILAQVKTVQIEIGRLNKEIDAANNDIKEKQEKTNELFQQLVFKNGQNQSLLDMLIALSEVK